MKNNTFIPTILIGYPVSHSLSPAFQNAAFKYLNINSVYISVDINPEHFDNIIPDLKKTKLMGINITLPYKQRIIKFADVLHEEALIIQSINTIEISDDGCWTGYNTDWFGVFKTLENNSISNNHEALIIGAGGSAPGAIYGLQKYGINKISITNKTASKVEALQDKFNLNSINFDDLKKASSKFSFLINCTTLGFDEILDKFSDEAIYFDLKYYLKPLSIKNFIDGKDMLLYQGSKSFEIWTKINAPVDVMRKALSGN